MPLVVQVDSEEASASLMPEFFVALFQPLTLLNESQLGVIPRYSPFRGERLQRRIHSQPLQPSVLAQHFWHVALGLGIGRHYPAST